MLGQGRVLCQYKQLDAEVLVEGTLPYFYGQLDAEGDLMAEGWHCTTTTASEAKFCIYIAIHTKQANGKASNLYLMGAQYKSQSKHQLPSRLCGFTPSLQPNSWILS